MKVQRPFIPLATVAALLLVAAGCGGGGGATGITFNDPSLPPSGHVSTDTASFKGNATCFVCHRQIAEEYSEQAHGQNFRNAHGRDLVAGSCAPCHTVGYNEPTGYNAGGTLNPALEGIQCEECHGPASGHNGNPANINKVPSAQETCWDCHVRSYKQLRTPVPPVMDTTMQNTAPGSVSVSHPQALMIAGVYGYQYPGSTYQNSSHTQISNTCVTCHLYPTRNPAGHNQESLEPDQAACMACHRSASELDAAEHNTQNEIRTMLIQLGGEDPANPGEPDASARGGLLAAYATAHNISLTTNNNPTDPAVQAYKRARWNYKFVLADASMGIHNHAYARQLLADAIASLQ